MDSLNQRLILEHRRASNAVSGNTNCCIGVDEVGRGCLAGPVVVAAICLNTPEAFPVKCLPLLRDSKTLSAKQRLRVYTLLQRCAIIASASASVAEIDQYNILNATLLAMQRAVRKLCPKLPASLQPVAIIDGNRAPELDIPHLCAVQGDRHYASVAAASIIAKTLRDRLMKQYHVQYPGYGWARNAGYGTQEHLRGLESHGVTAVHRRSFAPIRERATGYSSSK